MEKLTNEIYKGEKNLPSKESIVNFMLESGPYSREMAEIFDILKELDTNNRKAKTFYNNIPQTLAKKSGFWKKVHEIHILGVFIVIIVVILSSRSRVVFFIFTGVVYPAFFT